MCPCRTVRSEPRTAGVSPAQDASLRAEANRVMSPISASRTSAVNGPTPGSRVKTFTRGSDLACWRTSASSRPVTDSRASISARASETTSAETARSSSEASHSRPGPLQHPAGRSWPWPARTAWIRFCSSVRSRTSCARCRSSARSCRTAGGAIHASGSRSARSSCAKIAASSLSSPNYASRVARLRCRTRSRQLHRHSRPATLTSKSSSEEKLGGQFSAVCPVSVAIRLATWLPRPGNRHPPDSPTPGRRDG